MATLKSHVITHDENGDLVVLRPGETVPKWANITHPDAVEAPARKTKSEE